MRYRHLEGLEIDSTFSECGQFRYRLRITDTVKANAKTLCVIMQNPSEADHQMADKSVQFLEKLVFRSSYKEFHQVGKMIIVNQFAFVQKKDFEGTSRHIGPENDRIIKESIRSADVVLIAWGKNNPYEKRKKSIKGMISLGSPKVLLETRKHPSRGTYKDFIVPMK